MSHRYAREDGQICDKTNMDAVINGAGEGEGTYAAPGRSAAPVMEVREKGSLVEMYISNMRWEWCSVKIYATEMGSMQVVEQASMEIDAYESESMEFTRMAGYETESVEFKKILGRVWETKRPVEMRFTVTWEDERSLTLVFYFAVAK